MVLHRSVLPQLNAVRAPACVAAFRAFGASDVPAKRNSHRCKSETYEDRAHSTHGFGASVHGSADPPRARPRRTGFARPPRASSGLFGRRRRRNTGGWSPGGSAGIPEGWFYRRTVVWGVGIPEGWYPGSPPVPILSPAPRSPSTPRPALLASGAENAAPSAFKQFAWSSHFGVRVVWEFGTFPVALSARQVFCVEQPFVSGYFEKWAPRSQPFVSG